MRQKAEVERFEPIAIDPALCNGCGRCVEICQVDLFLPAKEKGGSPILAYPDECWHCGDCVDVCPLMGAIRLLTMPKNRVRWKRRDTGEDFSL